MNSEMKGSVQESRGVSSLENSICGPGACSLSTRALFIGV